MLNLDFLLEEVIQRPNPHPWTLTLTLALTLTLTLTLTPTLTPTQAALLRARPSERAAQAALL